MNASDKDSQPPRRNWLLAMATIVLAMLTVSALLNGVGPTGVAAGLSAGVGHQFATPGLTADERVHFAKVDRALGRLDLSEDGRIADDEALEPILEALLESVSRQGGESRQALDRARFLLEKSLPPAVADQLASLLPGYLRYRRAEHALSWFRGWRSPGTIEGAYVQYLVQHQLRREILGESATEYLFQATFRLTDLHFTRQMLMQREDLSDDEKRHLMDAQAEALAPKDHSEDAG